MSGFLFGDLVDLYGWDLSIDIERNKVDVTTFGATEKIFLSDKVIYRLQMERDGEQHLFKGDSLEEVEAKALKVMMG